MNELYHHGILGQRWGKRNGPPYPLDAEDHSAAEKKAGYEKSIRKAKRDEQIKESFKNDPILTNNGKNKISDAQAERLKDNYKKYLKSIAIIGGVTVASIVAYKVYKNYRQRAQAFMIENGATIKAGEALQRVSWEKEIGIEHPFYAARDKMDKIKYAGKLGFARKLGFGDAWKSKISLIKDIKVASKNDADEALKELLSSNPSFSKTFNTRFYFFGDGMNLFDFFNQGLVDENIVPRDISAKYYDILKSKGFGAVIDFNDIKYSGYDAQAPIIVFDTNAVVREYCNHLGNLEITSKLLADHIIENGERYMATAGGVAAAGATIGYTNKQNKEANQSHK